MVAFEVFRQDLTNLLLRCADHRRHGGPGCPDVGESRAIAALFERLAADVRNLDLQVFLVCQTRLRHQRLAGSFTQRRDDLLAQIGVTYCPANATELMCWMSRHSREADHVSDGSPLRFVPLLPGRGFGGTAAPARARSRKDGPSTISASVASDFAVAFGIVAPMLSVWEFGRAVGQWRDQQTLHATSPVPATVIASETIGGDRSPGLARQVVLSFQPTPRSASCQVAVRIGFAPTGPEPGSTMAVVPRTGNCEPPLLPSEIGDPGATVMLAASLMIGGLGSITLWDRIYRKKHGPPSRPHRRTRSRWGAASVRDGSNPERPGRPTQPAYQRQVVAPQATNNKMQPT